ncbi:glycine--tRNA ligase subunit beta [Thalassobacillus hwangdonensis]|uniref:Glycine--tRNA ligase beta subunit n=1 Tax=Thalassobacillus hwangdonensis TaxID=546108 RepID=A0ABW3L2I6_9BACI
MSNTLLFEIGLEEMPSRFIDDATYQLSKNTRQWLEELRIPYGEVKTFATPRRLAIQITGVADKQPDIEEEAKGPAKKIALDEEGNWTKAAIGFSKGQGKSVEDIYFKEIKGVEYVHINKFIEGEKTSKLLSGFKDIILSVNFPKNMRWGGNDLRYARPIRWLVALFNDQVLPFNILGVETGRTTYGHRFLGEQVEIPAASDYENQLKDQFVIADADQRKQMIVEQIEKLGSQHDWNILMDNALLNEVNHLVEYPTVFHGSFNEAFLTVPEEALITSMKEHQRYFPVRSVDGSLLPYFVAVRNGDDKHIDTVAKGNEKVLKARLADAQFFYEEDQKGSIAESVKKLERMVFQEELGTLADKISRTVKLVDKIANRVNVDEQTKTDAIRAAEISKFDLVTHMVDEFPELQGIMGEKYANLFGEKEAVARGIREHYMPTHANGELPESDVGSVVSLADKLDTIVGSFSIGLIPTGSQDPHGLRRQAIGILQILQATAWEIELEALLDESLQVYVASGLVNRSEEDVKKDLQEFFAVRAGYLLRTTGVEHDVIEAVLTSGIGFYPDTVRKAELLAAKRQDEGFKSTQESLSRVLNLAEKGKTDSVDNGLFENDSERALYNAYKETTEKYNDALESHKPEEALRILAELADPIDEFFDNTMVMAEEEAVRNNRLALLKRIAADIHRFADFNAIQWKQQF